MSRKSKFGLLLGGVAAAIVAYCLWASREPTYEGKRLGEWLDEGMKLAPYPYSVDAYSRYSSSAYSTNPPVERVVKAVQAIGTNAIPFLLRDMERKEEPHWLLDVKNRAFRLKLIDPTDFWSWRLNRSVWGFQALGTNAAPALQRLLVLHDGVSAATGSADAALMALGPFAVPQLESRLHATNSSARRRAAATLAYIGPPAEPAIPSLLALLDDTDSSVRQNAVAALACINRQPERFVPLFRGFLGDSNSFVRAYAADGLRRFGSTAQVAVPDLLRVANDADPNVSNSVRRALEQIESESSKAPSR